MTLPISVRITEAGTMKNHLFSIVEYPVLSHSPNSSSVSQASLIN